MDVLRLNMLLHGDSVPPPFTACFALVTMQSQDSVTLHTGGGQVAHKQCRTAVLHITVLPWNSCKRGVVVAVARCYTRATALHLVPGRQQHFAFWKTFAR
jgi:hypothetical protein